MTRMRMNQAIAKALADEMRADENVIVLGEDIAEAGGTFKATEGLLAEFGANRVRDTPIAEMGFLGAAVGAALTGLRPVVEIMFMEFLGVALDQLVTQAAKFHYLSGGRLRVPLVVRGSVGAGLGFGAQHSQTLENWLSATPGLKVAVPAGARTAYGLMRGAIRDENPVVILEPRPLYAAREELDADDQNVISIGTAETLVTGNDVTIVALGQMVPVAVAAAAQTQDWSAEVIDLRTIVPWDRAHVLASVGRTRRLVIVEESPYSGGWGADIAAAIGSQMYGTLAAPILRITCPDVPVPFSRRLERAYLPGPDLVRDQVTELMAVGRLPKPWWEAAGE